MKKLTPQEKKRLSYERDRRNRFGQNDKASRKLIPINKTKARKIYRRAASSIVPAALGDATGSKEELAEGRAVLADKKRWKKFPGVPLKDAIQGKKEWRVMRFGRKTGKGTPGGGLSGYRVNAELNSVDHEGILKQKKMPSKAGD